MHTTNLRPFHAAYPVLSLSKVTKFYCDLLGCSIGRHDDTWIDLNFFGHQLVFHAVDTDSIKSYHNPVDKDQVPVPHFGVILERQKWEELATTIREKEYKFIIEPKIRFQNQAGEQGTFFLKDPNGYHLEFKTFKNDDQIFAT